VSAQLNKKEGEKVTVCQRVHHTTKRKGRHSELTQRYQRADQYTHIP